MKQWTSLLGVVLMCAGCGSSAGPAAFVREADAVCRVYYDKTYALAPPIGFAQELALPSKQQAIRGQELSELRQITPPASARQAYAAYISLMAAADREFSAALAGLRRMEDLFVFHKRDPHDVVAANAAGSSARAWQLQARLLPEARSLGLSGCAQDPYSAQHDYNTFVGYGTTPAP